MITHPLDIFKKIDEVRSLTQVSVYFDGKRGWSLSYVSGNKVFNGSSENFARFLRKIQAKDATNPKSGRVYTYQEIVDRIMNGKDPVIYVWSNILNSLDKMVYNESEILDEIKKNKEIKENNKKMVIEMEPYEVPVKIRD